MGAYNIYEAKTAFSSLVDRAEHGEEIVIARAGKPVVKLVAIEQEKPERELRPYGQNLLGITEIPASFDDPLPEEYQRAFGMID